jgi:hypothetical protein
MSALGAELECERESLAPANPAFLVRRLASMEAPPAFRKEITSGCFRIKEVVGA